MSSAPWVGLSELGYHAGVLVLVLVVELFGEIL